MQHLAFAPLLVPTLHRFVVGIALRQQVALRPRVQNPQDGRQDRAGGHWFAPGQAFGDVFLGKVFEDAVPLMVTQTQHAGL